MRSTRANLRQPKPPEVAPSLYTSFRPNHLFPNREQVPREQHPWQTEEGGQGNEIRAAATSIIHSSVPISPVCKNFSAPICSVRFAPNACFAAPCSAPTQKRTPKFVYFVSPKTQIQPPQGAALAKCRGGFFALHGRSGQRISSTGYRRNAHGTWASAAPCNTPTAKRAPSICILRFAQKCCFDPNPHLNFIKGSWISPQPRLDCRSPRPAPSRSVPFFVRLSFYHAPRLSI